MLHGYIRYLDLIIGGLIMSEVVKKPLKITETVLRDAHQSTDCNQNDNRADASNR